MLVDLTDQNELVKFINEDNDICMVSGKKREKSASNVIVSFPMLNTHHPTQQPVVSCIRSFRSHSRRRGVGHARRPNQN